MTDAFEIQHPMASMISFQDHLRSLVMLRCEVHLKHVLPGMGMLRR